MPRVLAGGGEGAAGLLKVSDGSNSAPEAPQVLRYMDPGPSGDDQPPVGV